MTKVTGTRPSSAGWLQQNLDDMSCDESQGQPYGAQTPLERGARQGGAHRFSEDIDDAPQRTHRLVDFKFEFHNVALSTDVHLRIHPAGDVGEHDHIDEFLSNSDVAGVKVPRFCPDRGHNHGVLDPTHGLKVQPCDHFQYRIETGDRRAVAEVLGRNDWQVRAQRLEIIVVVRHHVHAPDRFSLWPECQAASPAPLPAAG